MNCFDLESMLRLQDVKNVACKFGNIPAKEVLWIESTAEETILKITSPAILEATDAQETVQISWTSDPSISVNFGFRYIWAYAPELVKVSPTSADIEGGEWLTLTMSSIHPDSIAGDVTVVFQQAVELPCSLLRYDANVEVWYCGINVPVNAGLIASTVSDSSGIGVFTSQQGRAKTVVSHFTFVASNMPRLVYQYPSAGPSTGAFVVLTFDNYCAEHSWWDYSVTFSTSDQSKFGQVQFVSFPSSPSCTTTLTVKAPTMDTAIESTGTMTPKDETEKSLTFTFSFNTQLSIKTSPAKAVVNSQPQITVFVTNLRAVSTGELCEGTSCASDHNVAITFGDATAILLQGPSSCSAGQCNLRAMPDASLVSVGLFEAQLSNHGSVYSSDNVVMFRFEVFEYDCESHCTRRGKIEDQALIKADPPASDVCLDKYCKEIPIRNPIVTQITNPNDAGVVAACKYNQACGIKIVAWQVTSETLHQDSLSVQLSVTFGDILNSVSANDLTLVSQNGDRIELKLSTPFMPEPMSAADVTVSGYDEKQEVLSATCQGCFKFKPVAHGTIEFVTGYPLTGLSLGARTVSTLQVANVPEHVTAADVQVSIGGSQVISIQSFSVSETFVAKILVVIPDHTSCTSSNGCAEPGFVSIPSLGLFADGFNFTYILQESLVIQSFYPESASISGGQEIVFQVANLATDSHGDYAYNAASSLAFKFGTSDALSASSAIKGNEPGTVAVTVQAPAQAAGSREVVLLVNDGTFANTTVTATKALEYYANIPFIEYLAPLEVAAGASIDFEVHIGNQAVPTSTSATTVTICGSSIPVVPEAKSDNSMKLIFSTAGCVGEQVFDIQINSISIGYPATSVTFTQPTVQVSPTAVSTTGYPIEIALYGLTEQVNAPSDLYVELGSSPVQILEVSSVLSSDPGAWTNFVAQAPIVADAGTVTMTVAHISHPYQNQTLEFEYLAAPYVQGLQPSSAYTKDTPSVTFDLHDFQVTNDASQLQCVSGSVELTVSSLTVFSYSTRKMRATLKLPMSQQAGVVVVKCSNRKCPESGTASFEFTYTIAPPVTSLDIQQGSIKGGTAVTVDIDNFDPISSLNDISITFKTVSGDLYAQLNETTLVYSRAASNISSARTQLRIITLGVDKSESVELEISSATQSTSASFLYVDEAIIVSNVSGVDASAQACQSFDNCQLSASGGSYLRVSLENFPYTTASEVSVFYSSKVAAVHTFVQTVNANTSSTITDLLLHFGAQVDAGSQQVSIRPSSDSNRVVYININFEDALTITRVLFANPYASELKLEFSSQIGKINGVSEVHSFLCSNVIIAAETLFGTNECYLSSNRTAIIGRVQHNRGVTVTSGFSISVLANSIESESGLSTLASSALVIQQPGTIIAPISVLSAPSMLDQCRLSATLKASASYGAGMLTFEWTSTSNSALQNFLESQSPEAAELELTSEHLPAPGQSIRVCVTVKDYFSSSPESCASIERIGLAIPTVEVTNPNPNPNSTLSIAEEYFFEGRGSFSTCLDRETLSYRWTVTPAISTTGMTTNQKSLKLPAGVLQANLEYEFRLDAWAATYPSNVGTTKTNVETSYPDLRCRIKGTGGEASSIKEFVLDASSSFDPANQQVEIDWVCTQQNSAGGVTQCFDSAGDIITASQNQFGIGYVAAHTFPEGSYTWEATIRAPASNRATSCEVSYQMKEQQVLQIDLAVPSLTIYKEIQYSPGITTDQQNYNFLANADQKLQITCAVAVNESEHVTFAWSLADSSLQLPEGILDSTTTTRSSTLSLPAYSFGPGQIGSLGCIAIGASARGASTFRVLVNDIPSGGSCILTPTEGARVTTNFKVQCSDFVDPTSSKLRYAFKYTNANGIEKQLRASMQSNSFDFILEDEPGNVTVTAVISDDLGAFSTRELRLLLDTSSPTSESLQIVVDGRLQDSQATGQSDETIMIVEACASAANAANTIVSNTSSSSGRRLLVNTVSTTVNYTQQLLDALDASSQSQVISTEEDAKGLLQSLSSAIHTAAQNNHLSSSQVEITANILSTAINGLNALASPTISSTTGSLGILLVEDLVISSAAVGSVIQQHTVASKVQTTKDTVAKITGSMLSVGESPVVYGSGCEFFQVLKHNPMVTVHQYSMQTSCANVSIPYSALPSSIAGLTSVTLVAGAHSPFRSAPNAPSPFGNFTSSMIDVALYPPASATRINIMSLSGSDRINISIPVADTNRCGGVSWDSNASSWNTAGVTCSAASSLSTGNRRLLTLQLDSTGPVAAIQTPVSTTVSPAVSPTASPTSSSMSPTVTPTTKTPTGVAPTAPSPTPVETRSYQLSTPYSLFDETTTSGQQLRSVLVQSVAKHAELDTSQVSITSLTGTRRTGVIVTLAFTGTPSANLDTVMVDFSASGFGNTFVSEASAVGITIERPVVTVVDGASNSGSSSDYFIPLWAMIASGAGFVLILTLIIGGFILCRNSEEPVKETEKKKGEKNQGGTMSKDGAESSSTSQRIGIGDKMEQIQKIGEEDTDTDCETDAGIHTGLEFTSEDSSTDNTQMSHRPRLGIGSMGGHGQLDIDDDSSVEQWDDSEEDSETEEIEPDRTKQLYTSRVEMLEVQLNAMDDTNTEVTEQFYDSEDEANNFNYATPILSRRNSNLGKPNVEPMLRFRSSFDPDEMPQYSPSSVYLPPVDGTQPYNPTQPEAPSVYQSPAAVQSYNPTQSTPESVFKIQITPPTPTSASAYLPPVDGTQPYNPTQPEAPNVYQSPAALQSYNTAQSTPASVYQSPVGVQSYNPGSGFFRGEPAPISLPNLFPQNAVTSRSPHSPGLAQRFELVMEQEEEEDEIIDDSDDEDLVKTRANTFEMEMASTEMRIIPEVEVETPRFVESMLIVSPTQQFHATFDDEDSITEQFYDTDELTDHDSDSEH